VDVPHLRVHVHGCPWSSVTVDVLTDVDQEALRSRPRADRLSAAKHLILGQMFLDQILRSDYRFRRLAERASHRLCAGRPPRAPPGRWVLALGSMGCHTPAPVKV